MVVTTAALSLHCSPFATFTHAGLLVTAPLATRTGANRTALLALHIARLVLVALCGLVLIAADQGWKNKQYSEWTEDDAKEVITDSPWVKTWRDQFVQFDAQVANLKCSQSFDTSDMKFHGNLEL